MLFFLKYLHYFFSQVKHWLQPYLYITRVHRFKKRATLQKYLILNRQMCTLRCLNDATGSQGCFVGPWN